MIKNEEARSVYVSSPDKFAKLVNKQIQSTNTTWKDKQDYLEDLKDNLHE